MGFWDALGQTVKYIGSGVSQVIEVSAINIDIKQKHKAIDQKYCEIGKRISMEKGDSGSIQSRIIVIKKNENEIVNLKQDEKKLERKIKILTTRLNKIKTGYFDSSPEVLELKTELSKIQEAINEKNELIEKHQLKLGKEAYSIKYKGYIYGSSYQYIDNLSKEISKLNLEAKQRKEQGKVDRSIIKSNIEYALSNKKKQKTFNLR